MLKPVDICDAMVDAGLTGLAAYYRYLGCPEDTCVKELLRATHGAVVLLAWTRMRHPKVTLDDRNKVFISSVMRYANLAVLADIATGGELGGLTGTALVVGALGLKWYLMGKTLPEPSSYTPQHAPLSLPSRLPWRCPLNISMTLFRTP